MSRPTIFACAVSAFQAAIPASHSVQSSPAWQAAKRAEDAAAFARAVALYPMAERQYALVGDAEGMARIARRLKEMPTLVEASPMTAERGPVRARPPRSGADR